MSAPHTEHVDVQAVRAAHPIEDVIASSGVKLHASGHRYLGCCPFHDDSNPSLSVGWVPGRFKCFGCGAAGDVIDYVSRRYDLSFLDSVAALQNGALGTGLGGPLVSTRTAGQRDLARISTERAYDINQMAWEHFATPVAAEFAHSYLARRRGIDLGALRALGGGAPAVGHIGIGWTALVSHLRTRGVSDDELLATDLAQVNRLGRLVDTYRGRIIIPVTNNAGRIQGFIGREVSGDSQAPKYRNPARTTTFTKSMVLYRPTHHPLAADANVVVVEGVLDALAIAAAAARAGEMDHFAPCSTNGVTASQEQVCRVLALHARPPVIAMDGDSAGVEGADRWLVGICLDGERPALVTTLPAGSDPADWLAAQGNSGLSAFDHRGTLRSDEPGIRPRLPGRQLARLLADRHPHPVRAVLASIVPLAAQLPPEGAIRFLRDVEGELTRRGWNPDGSFIRGLAEAVAQALSTSGSQVTLGAYPPLQLEAVDPDHNRSAFPDSPCVA